MLSAPVAQHTLPCFGWVLSRASISSLLSPWLMTWWSWEWEGRPFVTAEACRRGGGVGSWDTGGLSLICIDDAS